MARIHRVDMGETKFRLFVASHQYAYLLILHSLAQVFDDVGRRDDL